MASLTATQKRAQAKADYDAFLAGCPSRQLLDRISDKWVALVLAALGGDGPHPGRDCGGEPRSMRYSELSRRLAGVSQKMLTQTLRSLERDGMLTRTVTPTVPVTVTYELTALGSSLHDVMRDLKRWAEAHMDAVLTNRERYDVARLRSEGSMTAQPSRALSMRFSATWRYDASASSRTSSQSTGAASRSSASQPLGPKYGGE